MTDGAMLLRRLILSSGLYAEQTKTAEQVETHNPYQPPCFHDLPYLQPQPRD